MRERERERERVFMAHVRKLCLTGQSQNYLNILNFDNRICKLKVLFSKITFYIAVRDRLMEKQCLTVCYMKLIISWISFPVNKQF